MDIRKQAQYFMAFKGLSDQININQQSNTDAFIPHFNVMISLLSTSDALRVLKLIVSNFLPMFLMIID